MLPESVPPHVFVSSSALYPEFGVTVYVAVPLYPVVTVVGADTVPFVAVKLTLYPSPKSIVQ